MNLLIMFNIHDVMAEWQQTRNPITGIKKFERS